MKKFDTKKFANTLKKKIYTNLSSNRVFLNNKKDYSFSYLNKFLENINFQLDGIKKNSTLIVICNKSFQSYSAHIFAFISSFKWVPISENISFDDLENIINQFNQPIIIHNNYQFSGKIKEKQKINLASISLNESKKIKVFFERLKDTKAIYFTSGSSGKPKGVMLSLENILSNIYNINEILKIRKVDYFIDFHEVSFVISVPILINCFVNGSTLKPASFNDLLMIKKLKNSENSILITVPTLLRAMMKILRQKHNFKYLITCGEPIDKDLILEIKKKITYKKFFNFYGATEVAPWILNCDLDLVVENNLFIDTYAPAGKVMKFATLQIDESNSLQVYGPQVFKSYLGKKFSINKKKKGYFFYNTGDIFEKKSDYYFCKGRVDHQFKRRGYRLNILNLEANYKKILKKNILYVVFLDNLSKIFCITENKVSELEKKKIKNILPSFKHPDYYLDLKNQKKTSTGKISRTELKIFCKNIYNEQLK